MAFPHQKASRAGSAPPSLPFSQLLSRPDTELVTTLSCWPGVGATEGAGGWGGGATGTQGWGLSWLHQGSWLSLPAFPTPLGTSDSL